MQDQNNHLPPQTPMRNPGARKKEITPVFERHTKDKREGRAVDREKAVNKNAARQLKFDGR